jgi:aryl-alcohol dehydrogenase-like predicted oxidoreductase
MAAAGGLSRFPGRLRNVGDGGLLGSTGLGVSPIGLGLAALGRPAYINLGRWNDLGTDRSIPAMERRCHEMLDAAYSVGVRYVDAARSYGMAEAFLTSWFEKGNLPPDAMTIGSKWGYTYTGQWRLDAPVQEVKDLSWEALQRQVAESRALLGDRLRLYQIHSATLESGVLRDVPVLRELGRLRSQGLAIGLTVSGPRQSDVIRCALDVNVDGMNPFQSVQATWNLLETSAGPALADAKACGWGVIIKEALANGRLTNRSGGQGTAPLQHLAGALGTTVEAMAFAAALSQPWVDVVLSGAVTFDQLLSNMGALELTAHDVEWPSIEEPPNRYWVRRSAFAWA